MSRGNPPGAPIESRWTREEVEVFLARERPRYQRIELPYGLATDSQDRRETADLILPKRMDGMSFLDVGCFLGFFEHEALRSGAARAVGLDIDPDGLRQARGLADCLGLPVEFHRLDLERDPLPARSVTALGVSPSPPRRRPGSPAPCTWRRRPPANPRRRTGP